MSVLSLDQLDQLDQNADARIIYVTIANINISVSANMLTCGFFQTLMSFGNQFREKSYVPESETYVELLHYNDEFKILNDLTDDNASHLFSKLSIIQLINVYRAIDFFDNRSAASVWTDYIMDLYDKYSIRQMINIYDIVCIDTDTYQLYGNYFMDKFTNCTTHELNTAYNFIMSINDRIFLTEWNAAVYEIEEKLAIDFFEYHIEQLHDRGYPYVVDWTQLDRSCLSDEFIRHHRLDAIIQNYDDDDAAVGFEPQDNILDNILSSILSLICLPFATQMRRSRGKYRSDTWLNDIRMPHPTCYHNDQWNMHGINYDNFNETFDCQCDLND